MKRKTEFIISEGDAFFCNETAINSNPLHFILDFKNISPRTDVRSAEKNVVVIKHNVVMLEPLHAKHVANMLGQMIENYEKQFGKIEKNKAIKKFEKKVSKEVDQEKVSSVTPSYMG